MVVINKPAHAHCRLTALFVRLWSKKLPFLGKILFLGFSNKTPKEIQALVNQEGKSTLPRLVHLIPKQHLEEFVLCLYLSRQFVLNLLSGNY